MRKVWVWVAAAVLAVLTATVYGVTHAGSSSATPPAFVGASPQELAQYDDLVNRIYGTPEQRLLGEKYVDRLIQDAIRACMAKAGWGYVVPAFRGVETQTAPSDLDVTAPLNDLSISREVQQGAQAFEADLAAGDNPPWHAAAAKGLGDQYNKIETACSDTVSAGSYSLQGRPADRARAEYGIAAGRTLFNVEVEFGQAIRTYQAAPAVQAQLAGYRGCLRGYGFDVTSWLDLYNHVAAKYSGLWDTSWTELQVTPEWKVALTFEQRAETADATCRGDFRSASIHALRGVVATYSRNSDVAKLAAGWQAIEADALRAL